MANFKPPDVLTGVKTFLWFEFKRLYNHDNKQFFGVFLSSKTPAKTRIYAPFCAYAFGLAGSLNGKEA
jgi:hypothetical protein